MYDLRKKLIQEQSYLETIIKKANELISDLPEISGNLRISQNHENVRYYHCVDDRYGEYISRENSELPRLLAQKKYNASVLKKAEHRFKQIEKLLKDYSDNEIEEIYNSLHSARKALVTPVEPTIEQLEQLWYDEPYSGKAFQEGMPLILTERGERVRSKSEKILADYFSRNNIHYKYEKPLNLGGYGIVYPDFTFFSRKLRKEIYWEHEGMMDKSEYAKSAVKKINSYQANGIFPGERLIITYETEQDTLNSEIIHELTERYLR